MIATVEIPRGTTNKYEYDKFNGKLILDRVVSVPYPQSYGFINETLAPDNDALDVFVVAPDSIVPLTEVKITPVAMIEMLDNGVIDNKVIATVDGLSVNTWTINNIMEFLRTYKSGTEVSTKIVDKLQTEKYIKECQQRYEEALW
jgi:inorganic pyrophosphatase